MIQIGYFLDFTVFDKYAKRVHNDTLFIIRNTERIFFQKFHLPNNPL